VFIYCFEWFDMQGLKRQSDCRYWTKKCEHEFQFPVRSEGAQRREEHKNEALVSAYWRIGVSA
jgi:hypothetical protein